LECAANLLGGDLDRAHGLAELRSIDGNTAYGRFAAASTTE
jgi:hypothetical protein